jgi:hypothetical protein
MGTAPAPLVERIQGELAQYLGPHTAGVAIRRFAERSLKVAPEAVSAANAPQLLDALLPMLRTLLGSVQGDALVQRLKGMLA